MNIVISALHFQWTTVQHCLDRVRNEFGIDGVEFSWSPSFARPHCTKEDMDALERRTHNEDMHCSAHIWENIAQLGLDSGPDALRRWIDCCGSTGVTHLILHGGSWPNRTEGVKRACDVLMAVAPDAEAAGVTICLENHYAFDYRDCQELFSESWEFDKLFSQAPDNIAFCFDTGHGHLTNTWEELITDAGSRLHYVHLAGNHGIHDDHCAFRQGNVPWDAMFDLLQTTGFDGTFCVEFPVLDDHAPFRSCLAEIRERFGSTQP